MRRTLPTSRDRGLRPGRTELSLHGLQQLGGIEHLSALHHDLHVARVADVLNRVSANHEQVGELPRFDGTEPVARAECTRAVNGGDLEHLRRGNSGAHHGEHLAMR
jgi:hypothetical protein